jgi:hypothetical protein
VLPFSKRRERAASESSLFHVLDRARVGLSRANCTFYAAERIREINFALTPSDTVFTLLTAFPCNAGVIQAEASGA